MKNEKNYYVFFNNLREHERIIFKLICSVSQRSKGRENKYILQDELDSSSVDIIISDNRNKTTQPLAAKANYFEVFISDDSITNDEIITRPLIATKVLAQLDQLIIKYSNTSPVQKSDAPESDTPKIDTPDSLSTTNHDNIELTGIETEEIIFDICEEEASELAIVHDESLANPANTTENASCLTPSPSILPFTKKEDSTKLNNTINTAHPQKSPRALVVDDSPSVRKQLELELDLFDVQVDYAESAEQAFSLLEQYEYNIAFLDVVLPDKDGYQICKHIKTDCKNTIAIMLTGKATQSDKIKGSLAGCDAYLVKPVGRETFQNTTSQYLSLNIQEKITEDVNSY